MIHFNTLKMDVHFSLDPLPNFTIQCCHVFQPMKTLKSTYLKSAQAHLIMQFDENRCPTCLDVRHPNCI